MKAELIKETVINETQRIYLVSSQSLQGASYKVTITTDKKSTTMECTCLSYVHRREQCKHINTILNERNTNRIRYK